MSRIGHFGTTNRSDLSDIVTRPGAPVSCQSSQARAAAALRVLIGFPALRDRSTADSGERRFGTVEKIG
jgi:hypothetical protein